MSPRRPLSNLATLLLACSAGGLGVACSTAADSHSSGTGGSHAVGAGGAGDAASTGATVTVGAGGSGGGAAATTTTGSGMPPDPDAGPITPLGVKITPGEVQIPVEQYDKAPLMVTSALFGGHGKTAADPIVIKNCKIKADLEGDPAILIAEPGLTVVIDGCTLVGVSPVLISAAGLMYKGKYVDGGQARLTVKNTRGYGLKPLSPGHGRPRFLTAGSPVALTVEHNYLEHVSGVYVPNPKFDGGPFLFRYNKVKDLDARMLNMTDITSGNGGEPGEGHFVHLSGKKGSPASVPGIEIGWNELVSFPDESASGDHINIYTLSGTPVSPMQVHHNYIQGGYPYPSSYQGQGCRGKAGGGSTAYTGSGVTTDGHGPPIAAQNDVTSWVEFHDNRIVNACNGAINIAIGHDVRAHDNRLIHSGIIPDAAQTPAFNFLPGGIYDWANTGPTYFHDNSFDHNTIWWPKAGVKPYDDNGQFAASIHDNVDAAAMLGMGATPADEVAEYDAFLAAVQAAGNVLGPM